MMNELSIEYFSVTKKDTCLMIAQLAQLVDEGVEEVVEAHALAIK